MRSYFRQFEKLQNMQYVACFFLKNCNDVQLRVTWQSAVCVDGGEDIFKYCERFKKKKITAKQQRNADVWWGGNEGEGLPEPVANTTLQIVEYFQGGD